MSDRIALERDRGLAAVLDDAFGLLFRHFGVALALTALVVIPIELLVSGVGLGQLTASYDDTPSDGGTAFAGVVSIFVTMPLVTGMLVRLVRADAEGEPVSFGACVRAGLETFPLLLPAVVLSVLGIVVGFLCLIVPGIFLAIRWAVIAPAVAVEGERGTGALRRSWDLVTGHSWWVLGVTIVLALLVGVVGTLIALPFEALAESADREVVVLVGAIVGQLLALPFSAMATVILFFTLRARYAERSLTGGAVPPLPQDDAPARSAAPPGWEPPVPPR